MVKRTGTAFLLDKGGHAAHLESMLDLVEGVAVVAYYLAGPRDVDELFCKLKQRELPLGTLGQVGHSVAFLADSIASRLPIYPGRPGAASLFMAENR